MTYIARFCCAVCCINVQCVFETGGAAPRCRLRSARGVSLDLIIGWSCRYVAGQVQSCWKIHHSTAFIITKAKVLLRQASSRTVPFGGFQLPASTPVPGAQARPV